MTRTLEGIEIQPLYTRADLTAPAAAAGWPGQAPYTRGALGCEAAPGWDIRQEVTHPDPAVAGQQVRQELARGAASVQLCLDPAGATGVAVRSAGDLDLVLAGPDLATTRIALKSGARFAQAAHQLREIWERRGVAAADARADLLADPVGAWVVRGGVPGGIEALLADMARLAADAAAGNPAGPGREGGRLPLPRRGRGRGPGTRGHPCGRAHEPEGHGRRGIVPGGGVAADPRLRRGRRPVLRRHRQAARPAHALVAPDRGERWRRGGAPSPPARAHLLADDDRARSLGEPAAHHHRRLRRGGRRRRGRDRPALRRRRQRARRLQPPPRPQRADRAAAGGVPGPGAGSRRGLLAPGGADRGAGRARLGSCSRSSRAAAGWSPACATAGSRRRSPRRVRPAPATSPPGGSP
ncbi:MAG: hypothetical protein IPI34_09905 [bacterium]|nr:hypothetical protein [bacterium]